MSNTSKWIITVMAVASAFVALAGCAEDPDWIGAAGMTVTNDGHPVVVIAVCSQYINDVTVWNSGAAAEPTNTKSAKQLNSQYRSVKHVTGTAELDLSRPGPDWQPHSALDVTGSKEYVVLAKRDNKDAEVSQVNFSTKELAALKPGTVYTNKDDLSSKLSPVASVKSFAAHTCKSAHK